MPFYKTEKKRFVIGRYVEGAPGSPVVVELPDGVQPDAEFKRCNKDGSDYTPPPEPTVSDEMAGSSTAQLRRK